MSGLWYETDLSSIESSSEVESAEKEDHLEKAAATEEFSVSDDLYSENSKRMEVRGKSTAKWLSGSWLLKPFEENLPLNKRKAEWIRFRNQFERIFACKEPVGPEMQLAGMKIFAGNYLLSVIELQEKLPASDTDNIYTATIYALNKYFDQTCDYTKERMKFREMRMGDTEPFVDWVLRLETQAKFCEFELDQSKEELMQALLRRSVPEIAQKLYEMSDVFSNNLEKIMTHGRHLDYMRMETDEAKQAVKVESSYCSVEQQLDDSRVVKPINAVLGQKFSYGPERQGFNHRSRWWADYKNSRYRGESTRGRAGRYYTHRQNCSKCGRVHGPKECMAFRVKCYACGKEGHFAEFCFSSNSRTNQGQRERPYRSFMDKDESGKINQLITGGMNPLRREQDPRLVSCMIGTEHLEFLVDSGATVNTITTIGWQKIKRNCRSVIQEIMPHLEEILLSYANQQPLEVECSFKAFIGVNSRPLHLAKFFVVKGARLSLLSYDTAFKMNLIRIGGQDATPEYRRRTDANEIICSISDTRLEPKMLDIEVTEPLEFPKMPIAPLKFKVDDSVSAKQIIRYNIPKAFESAINESTDFRIVVDYREVNKAIIREPHPMPSLDKIWTEIPNGTLFFTKLDLKDAYFHVELHEEVHHFTTFMTANGLMRFRRLPFGLSCAPELFQRVMEKLLIKCKHVIVYLDDILVFGNTILELQQHVAEVQKVLVDNNLTVNEEKSVYDQSTVDFLGFTIDGSGISPTTKKISDIALFEKPKDASETKPLRDLLAEHTKFEWKIQHQEAFEALKNAVENDLVKRGYFNEDDQTILYTDASPWGLGAILVQEGKEDDEHRIIACASKSLTATECRYPQLHREALAIVWAMEKFSYYLLGRNFVLRSDSEALMFMTKSHRKDVGKRILSRAEGWMLRMDHFSYKFEHVAGKDNIADAASRIGTKRKCLQFGMEKEPHELFAVTAKPDIINEHMLALTNAEVQKKNC
ncbi:uncharacterized protein LOC131687716 [Topomyia yanbarensis]|uniref:uncharacterized protein LOC131687716 n=1 Tax=Topomyia yanbarensis TaxID=2498891 RepID=UPI00273AA44D|nr:uncharacterized protein LOC131687716 [Topomyia yanbarensis]